MSLFDSSNLIYTSDLPSEAANSLNGIDAFDFSGLIDNNNVSYNYLNGILLINLGTSEIDNNTLIGNNGYGIDNRIAGDVHTQYFAIIIQFNLFYSNRENLGSQAYDESYTNPTWIHNYWSNFTGYDLNSDGFYDNPYAIDGPAGSNDPASLINSPLGNTSYPVFTTFTPQTVTVVVTTTTTSNIPTTITSNVPTTITNQKTVTESNSNTSNNSSNTNSSQNSTHRTDGFGIILILVGLIGIFINRKRKLN